MLLPCPLPLPLLHLQLEEDSKPFFDFPIARAIFESTFMNLECKDDFIKINGLKIKVIVVGKF